MVKHEKHYKQKAHKRQAKKRSLAEVKKISAKTPYDFKGRHLTPYGGLLPLVALLEKLKFKELIDNSLTIKRIPHAMSNYQFILSILIAIYIGFSRLAHLVYIASDPIITGILKVTRLPVQSTFWRFLQSLRIFNVTQLEKINTVMMARVWEALNLSFSHITIDTDTTVNTVYGKQMGAKKGYNPKKKGKKSYQPIFSFIAQTGEFIGGKQRKGDRPTGEEVAQHLREVFESIPKQCKRIFARADAGFYCKEAIAVYREYKVLFAVVAQKTTALIDQLYRTSWQKIKSGEEICEFFYQPIGWERRERFVAIRYPKEFKPGDQLGLFEEEHYLYRVFVTDIPWSVLKVVDFYDGRAGAENLIKEASNDAGVAAAPSGRFIANMNFFLLAMLAYNFNRWLTLFALEENEKYQRTMLSTARLKYLFIGAKITFTSNRTEVHYGEDYPHKEKFNWLMEKLRKVKVVGGRVIPLYPEPLKVVWACS
jgi:hypothetical protein